MQECVSCNKLGHLVVFLRFLQIPIDNPIGSTNFDLVQPGDMGYTMYLRHG